MARSPYQKLKPLYIMNYLLQNSDEEHPVTIKQIVEYLGAQGISAERKSIYDDIEALRFYGLDIIHVDAGRFQGYYVAQRNFELPELKLLVDSVQSSKFITHKKTMTLIRKIEKLTSRYEARKLQRQVVVADRIKAMNESIYYNVDKLHSAIALNQQIIFRYFEWTVSKEIRMKKNGENYHVSPWALTWDNENYYLIGYDMDAEIIKHFRVDKMLHIELTGQDRAGREEFSRFDLARYTKRTFGMFGGNEETVRIRFHNRFVGVVIDRFGKNVALRPDGENYFIARVEVAVSEQFFGWITGLG